MIQLRIRTEYSFGLTFSPIARVVQRLKEIGCTAAGIVDVNSTWGHVPFYHACVEAGIQPLLGVELIVSDDDTTQRMWFLAASTEGLRELYRFSSKAHQQQIATKVGSYPRLYRADVLSMSGSIQKFAGDITDGEFLRDAGAFLDISCASRIANAAKMRIAEAMKLSVVETSDNAYAYPEDRETFEFASNRGLKATPQHILDTTLYGQETAEWIAQRGAGMELPVAPMIQMEGDLETICREGIKYRKMKWTKKYEERLQYELGLIKLKKYESYFIMVADMVQHAKRQMLVGPSRGSSAGSLVCYVARITEIDPIKAGLYFERFIDVTRTDLPDIDIDHPDTKRQMVFDYMAEKYGDTNVAHIGTISQFKPKSALIQVCKKLNIPPTATWAVKTAMIERALADERASNCLEDTFNTTEPGREFIAQYPQAAIASKLEGHASHTGVHAAGLLVCNDSISDYCTVTSEGIAQIDKHSAETLGLLKIDVLGLRTLGVLEDSGVNIDWYNLPLDDPKALAIFNSGRMCGIFQFEGDGLRQVSQSIKFNSIREVDAVTAIARPGPFVSGVAEKYIKRHNGEPYQQIHPKVDALMKTTYGLPLYQEDTLAIVRDIGGFSWEETSFVRKAISKRQGQEFFGKFGAKFKEGAAKLGIPADAAETTWRMIDSMGAWQMNKCTAEGTLVFLTASGNSTKRWVPVEELYELYVKNPTGKVKRRGFMPRLMSLFPDGIGRPQRAKKIFKNGIKQCVQLIFDDGTSVTCTEDHRFLIDGKWMACKDASINSEFVYLKPGKVEPKKAGRPFGAKNTGRTLSVAAFRKKHAKDPCQDCRLNKQHMEVHHNDFEHGRIRKDDLAWICRSCHSDRHKAAGEKFTAFTRGYQTSSKILVEVRDAGVKMTYDIEMEKHHNYVINGGIITHNSHTYSYAVISMWCAWLKAHHPLEFAAANLRNARDEDKAVELLREMVREGIEYLPFDLTLSEMNWAVKDGILVGGFVSLKGIGESKAAKLIEARNAGKLTAKQKEDIGKADSVFKDIFPFRTKYGSLYDNPDANGIVGPLVWIADIGEGIPHREERVFIGELIHKNPRNANDEDVRKKRGGSLERDNLEFLDVRLRDDTGTIGGRIGRYDYRRIGREMLEKIPIGAHMLIRAKFYHGIRYCFISKWKRLDV